MHCGSELHLFSRLLLQKEHGSRSRSSQEQEIVDIFFLQRGKAWISSLLGMLFSIDKIIGDRIDNEVGCADVPCSDEDTENWSSLPRIVDSSASPHQDG